MFTWYRILRNAVDYPIRQTIRWRRRGARIAGSEEKSGIFAHLKGTEAQERENEALRLVNDYQLHDFADSSRRETYTINLFYLAMLERAFQQASVQLPRHLRAADIGTGSWPYAPALHAFLSHWQSDTPRDLRVQGFEIDPYRVHIDLRSRMDHAEANLQNLSGMTLSPEPFAPCPGIFDLVTNFYPFVLLEDHLEWGLPRALFQPEKLLRDAWTSLQPGGVLFVTNQGKKEFETQKEIFADLSIPPGPSFHFASTLHDYEIPRFAHLRVKPSAFNQP
jgi:SAM-dependent methyltransferase